jgi:hypothetical protein
MLEQGIELLSYFKLKSEDLSTDPKVELFCYTLPLSFSLLYLTFHSNPSNNSKQTTSLGLR